MGLPAAGALEAAPQKCRGDDCQDQLADQPGNRWPERLPRQQDAAEQDERQKEQRPGDVEAVVDVQASAELDEAARQQRDQ